MPDIIRDNHSGALIFRPTPQEAELSSLKEQYAQLNEELKKKLEQLDIVLEERKILAP